MVSLVAGFSPFSREACTEACRACRSDRPSDRLASSGFCPPSSRVEDDRIEGLETRPIEIAGELMGTTHDLDKRPWQTSFRGLIVALLRYARLTSWRRLIPEVDPPWPERPPSRPRARCRRICNKSGPQPTPRRASSPEHRGPLRRGPSRPSSSSRATGSTPGRPTRQGPAAYGTTVGSAAAWAPPCSISSRSASVVNQLAYRGSHATAPLSRCRSAAKNELTVPASKSKPRGSCNEDGPRLPPIAGALSR